MPHLNAAPSSQPLHLPRVKQNARRLAYWTSIPLSRAQELTATLLGATSWQALLAQPTFVPDEALLLSRPGSFRGELVERYRHGIQVLARVLDICEHQAAHLLHGWQPTALTPRYYARVPGAPSGLPERTLIHDFGAHAGLPPGMRLAWLSNEEEHEGLYAVMPGRLARFMDARHTLLVSYGSAAQRSAALEQALALEEESNPKYFAGIARALRDPAAIQLQQTDPVDPCPAAAPVQVAWLRQPLDEQEVLRRAAQELPWRAEDYLGRLKREEDIFWTMQTPELTIGASVLGPSAYYFVRNRKGTPYCTAEVAVGVGSLMFMEEDRTYREALPQPGYCLVKYRNQIHGSRPLPLSAEQAQEVVTRSGLGSETQPELSLCFYESEAGLALAKWVAAHPRRARRLAFDRRDFYIGDWWGTSLERLEFELLQTRG